MAAERRGPIVVIDEIRHGYADDSGGDENWFVSVKRRCSGASMAAILRARARSAPEFVRWPGARPGRSGVIDPALKGVGPP